jgi:hypothetical protein
VRALEASVQSVLSKLLKYFQLALRKDSAIATDNATELTAINANGGSGGARREHDGRPGGYPGQHGHRPDRRCVRPPGCAGGCERKRGRGGGEE